MIVLKFRVTLYKYTIEIIDVWKNNDTLEKFFVMNKNNLIFFKKDCSILLYLRQNEKYIERNAKFISLMLQTFKDFLSLSPL